MVEMQVEAMVPESRQVTVTLPPEIPTGPVRLRVVVESEAVPAGLRRLRAIMPYPETNLVFSGQLRVPRSEENAQ